MKYKSTGLEEGPQGIDFSPLQEQDTKYSKNPQANPHTKNHWNHVPFGPVVSKQMP